MTLAQILTMHLGGRWHGGYGTARCPVHDDKRPSLSIRDGDRGILVKCHTGCDGQAVIDELKRRNFWPVEPAPAASKRKRSAEDTRRYVLETWRSCRPAAGTHVETYLGCRGITMEMPSSIRFHPGLKHGDTGLLMACMVAAVQGSDSQITALHRTFLRADGEGKAQVSSPRKMLGSVRGGAVRLAAPGPELAIGEGIETSLSFQQITGTPTWAALSASGLMTVELPSLPFAATVFILVDLDPAGEEAAQVAARQFDHEGRRVNLVRPNTGKDLNDALEGNASPKSNKGSDPFKVVPFRLDGAITKKGIRTVKSGRLLTAQEATDDARRRWPEAYSVSAGDAPSDYIDTPDRLITIAGGERHIAADQGLAALIDAKVPFYQRDRIIQRVTLVTAKNTSGEVMTVPGIAIVDQAMLGRALGRSAMWQRFDLRMHRHVRIDPPMGVCAQMLSMVGEWPFPPLHGIIQCPTLRREGSLLDREGYDAETGLVLVGSVAMPPISPSFRTKITRYRQARLFASPS